MVFCPACEKHHLFDFRWQFNGDFERPTFTGSMLVYRHEMDGRLVQKRCHSFVTNGQIRYEPDSEHDLVNQTVELPEV
jgi:hypothetical protein